MLHLDPNQIKEVTVENPIELGKSYGDKDFILDIKALMDGNLITNLEMQVINEHNWQNRSLSYLCRSFDRLNKGDLYLMARPAYPMVSVLYKSPARHNPVQKFLLPHKSDLSEPVPRPVPLL